MKPKQVSNLLQVTAHSWADMLPGCGAPCTSSPGKFPTPANLYPATLSEAGAPRGSFRLCGDGGGLLGLWPLWAYGMHKLFSVPFTLQISCSACVPGVLPSEHDRDWSATQPQRPATKEKKKDVKPPQMEDSPSDSVQKEVQAPQIEC